MSTTDCTSNFEPVARSIVDLVGNTPLLDLSPPPSRSGSGRGVRVLAKAEFANPGGSVKDRPALHMIRAAEASGELSADRRLLDATSGNTGIALAMFSAALGHRITLCLPENASNERKTLLRAYGAEVVLTDPMEGSDGAITRARELFEQHGDLYLYLDQYSNPANPEAHYLTTGPELLAQAEGTITHFVTGLGTSGTFMGVGRFLREVSPATRLVSVEPNSPLHGLEGMKHMASALVPSIYDETLADERLEIATEDALARLGLLARERGLLVGKSAAANVEAAYRVARDLEEGTVVTILCDSADRYLSEPFWSDIFPEHALSASSAPSHRLVLSEELFERARDHAVSTYPAECCGVLIGSAKGMAHYAVEAHPAENARAEADQHNRYLIPPDMIARLMREAGTRGLDIVGYYHSHPDHPSQPSEFDRDHAWPNTSYLIFAIREGRPESVQSWRLRDDRSRFDEETIERVRKETP